MYQVETLVDHVGENLGTSAWHEITQDEINRFAKSVKDFHPVHVDPEFARQRGLNGTIAHGPYLMAIGPKMLYELVDMRGSGATLLAGYNRVRFLSPVDVDSRVRLTATLDAADPVPSGTRFTFTWTFEIEGQERPAGVAEALLVSMPAPDEARSSVQVTGGKGA